MLRHALSSSWEGAQHSFAAFAHGCDNYSSTSINQDGPAFGDSAVRSWLTQKNFLINHIRWSVGCTTIWSGVSYAFSTTSVRRIH